MTITKKTVADKIAAYPKDQPVRPEDIAATVYQSLGIYDNLWATDSQGRPYHLLEQGRPLPLSMLRQAIQRAPGATPIWLPAPSSPTMVPVTWVP